ncbi:LPS ABC transporter substrate-binding protein LptA [Mesorhizobium sp. DCY119]|jgi:lipopolysaccharide export system protein LptA|nr:LPS ABC transporter substrate-binding protein LptA [Mesorhizobium sp. DCY119]SFU13513.1 lipopolysaccharide export system protein LptA [Mesorhizobium sp. YR577]
MWGNKMRLPLGAVLGLAVMTLAPGQVFAQDSAQSRLSGLNLSGKDPIQIESDKLEVRESENKAIFSGNVTVVQGPTLLKSGKMTVFYAKDGGSAATGSSNIDRLEVEDKVYVKSNTQVATGDRGTFDMKTEILVLSGDEVVMSDGPNVLVGCKLTVQMKTGEANVDGCKKGNSGSGRVMMSITPGSTPGATTGTKKQ